jgi:hypothetical protein
MRLIAFITEPEPVQRVLLHLGEPVKPPPISPARSPPVAESFDWNQSTVCDPERGEPAPEFDKSSGKTICTAKRPEGWRIRKCAMNSIKRGVVSPFA